MTIAIALLLAACGGGSGSVAATVNGEDITVSQVEGVMAGEAASGDSAFSEALSTLIQWEITSQAAESEFGIGATDAEVDDEKQALLAQYGATSIEEFLDAQGISEDLFTRFARQIVIQRGVTVSLEPSVPEPTEEDIAAEIAANAGAWTEVCASHFLVETEEEAQAALVRVEAGEAFADVATEVSLDTGSAAVGGNLGCNSPEGFVAEFALATLEAPIDEAYGPVETEFGFHVVLVSSREEATTDEVRSFLTQEATFAASEVWFDEAVDAADVTVAEQYGTWKTDPPSIVAVD